MANPPPPYSDITGISRAVMKDNAQETLANYNGNARPGEIVADLTTDPPALYIGNNLGQLTALAGGGGGYGNTQVAQFLTAGLVGNIIPAGNNTNSLGNATNQWNGLYISNTTIYMNGVPISLGPGNVLTVDGNEILSNGSNVTVSTTGNVTASYFVGDGSLLTGISAFGNFISNGDSNVTIDTPNGNIAIHANTTSWSFDNTGNLTLPLNGQIILDGGDGYIGPDGDDMIISWDNEVLIIQAVTDNINLRTSSSVIIETGGNIGNATGRWDFSSTDGRLNGLPVNPAGGYWNAGFLQFVGNSSGDGNGFTTLTLTPDDTVPGQALILDPTAPGHIHLRAPGIGGNIEQPTANIFLGPEQTNFEITAQYDVAANARINSGGYTWQFVNNGNLVLPSDANIVGSTPNNAGYQQWLGNSAGDGSGATTLRLIPDVTLEGNEQYIIIDPTGGGDIHVRPGGNIDNSNGRLILGGENSAFVVESGPNPPVKIFSDENEWIFYGNAELQAPGAVSAVGNITGSYFIGNGSQVTDINAVTVDITDTNGLTTIYYPTFVENRTTAQIARADVNFTYRTDTNTLTVGDIVTSPVPLANLTPVAGARAFVSDANLVAAGNFGANISGGASNTVPVWSDGTNWYIG